MNNLINITNKNACKQMSRNEEHFGIDIFSGAGGLSLGAEMAGINIRYAIEVNESAAKTFRLNHKGVSVICEDITKLEPNDFIDKHGVFIIMGGPPCQGFSMSNTMNRNMDNPKNLLFKEFVRFVKEIKPTWFVFENVWGLTHMNNGETQKIIEQCFEELGYTVSSKVLWASDYGVPQKRNRFFLIGNRNGIKYEFPEPFDYQVTVKDAIEDLPLLQNGDNYETKPYRLPISKVSKYAQEMRKNSIESTQNYVSRNNDLVIKRYSYIKQGENWRAIPDFLMENYADKKRTHSGIYKRLKEDSPSVVISNYRKSMLIHPTQDRGLSVREAARIQSFPDDFYFEGPISHIQQQIGNAVPPLLAKAVIEKILSYCQNE